MIASDRTFKIWQYSVSHGMLLLRSPTDEGNDTNMDVVFAGVRYVELPAVMKGIEVVSASSPASEIWPSAMADDVLHTIRSQGAEYFVVGGVCRAYENKLSLFDAGFLPRWQVTALD